MQFMPLSIPFLLLHTKSLLKKKKHHILETFTNFNTKSYKPQNRKPKVHSLLIWNHALGLKRRLCTINVHIVWLNSLFALKIQYFQTQMTFSNHYIQILKSSLTCEAVTTKTFHIHFLLMWFFFFFLISSILTNIIYYKIYGSSWLNLPDVFKYKSS